MSLTDKFSTDNIKNFVTLTSADEEVFRALIDWIYAPPNLQQFRPAICNLIDVFTAQINPKVLGDLEVDTDQIAAWISLLNEMNNDLPLSFEHELKVLQSRKNTRPDGLIGSYPIYASLIAETVEYPESEKEKARTLHFFALAAASGYQRRIISKEVLKATGGIDVGMRSIRNLETDKKRPLGTLPDLRNVTSMAEGIEILERWVASNQDYPIGKLWGESLRLLFTSFAEQREGIKRGKSINITREIKRIKIVDDSDNEYTDETTQNQTSKLSTVLSFSTPDKESASLLSSAGLHPAEMNRLQSISFNDPDEPQMVQNNLALTRRRQRGRLQAIVQKAQYLFDEWSNPTGYEIEFLFRYIAGQKQPDLDNLASNNMSELHSFLLLKIWTGRTTEELLSFRFFKNKNEYDLLTDPVIAFILDSEELALPIQSPAKNRGIDAVDKKLLSLEQFNTDDTALHSAIFFKLPESTTKTLLEFAKTCKKAYERKRKTIVFQRDHEEYSSLVRAYLKAINKQYLTRWTDQRISRIMRIALIKCSGDQVFVYLATGQEIGHSVVSAHYQKTESTRLTAIVEEAHKWIQSWAKHGPQHFSKPLTFTAQEKGIQAALGSDLAVPDGLVHEYCCHLKHHVKRHLKAENSLEKWVNVHNALVAYISIWLGFCSGYRAVTDPLSDPRHLDRKTGALVIRDKDNEFYSHSRVVILPEDFVKQIDYYAEHLATFSNKVSHRRSLQDDLLLLSRRYLGKESSTHELSVPFLFFFGEQLRIRDVSSKTLKEHLPTQLPINTNRHYLRSKLSASGVSAEAIDYFMGHWEHGEEPYQKYSSISPAEISLQLQEALEEMSKAAGWKPLRGLSGG